MEKEKIILPIGSNKALVFEADPDNEWEQEKAKEFQEVAATHPQSIQEFFIRLNDLQKKKHEQKQREKLDMERKRKGRRPR